VKKAQVSLGSVVKGAPFRFEVVGLESVDFILSDRHVFSSTRLEEVSATI